MPYRNIVLIRIDRVGDLLLSTPLMRNIREAHPGAAVSLVVTPYNAEVLKGWSAVDNFLVYDPGWRLAQKRRFAMQLRGEAYDLCLVLSPATEAHVLAWLTRAPVRGGIVYSRRVAMRLLAPLLLTHPLVLHIDEAIERKGPIPHEVRQVLQLGASVGLPDVEYGLAVPVSEEDSAWAAGFIEENCPHFDPVGFHLSPKWLTGGWTGGDIAALFNVLLDEVQDAPLLVTYGAADSDAVVQYGEKAELCSERNDRIHLAGNLSFGRWAALFARCRAVITTDTGSLHVAAALGRPVVAVYEKATFYHCSRQWAPWKVPHMIIEKNEFPRTKDEIVKALRSLL